MEFALQENPFANQSSQIQSDLVPLFEDTILVLMRVWNIRREDTSMPCRINCSTGLVEILAFLPDPGGEQARVFNRGHSTWA